MQHEKSRNTCLMDQQTYRAFVVTINHSSIVFTIIESYCTLSEPTVTV